MKIAAVVVLAMTALALLAMTALALLALILASVAVIFDEREKPDFEDKAFVFGALAGSAGVGLFLCLLAMTVIS